MRRPVITNRRSNERGAVAVETALVSLLLVTMVYGLVETSFLIKDWLSVSTSARAGARMASSEPRVSSGTNQAAYADDAVLQVVNGMGTLDKARVTKIWVYRANQTTGKPDSGSYTSCTTCVRYTYKAATQKFTADYVGWQASEQNACVADAAHDAVGVYVEYTHKAVLGMFFDNYKVAESTVMSLEPIPTTVQCRA